MEFVCWTSASAPSRSAMFASTSGVQQRLGAVRLTLASPVESPDLFGTELAARLHPLLVDQRLDRAGVNGALPARECRQEHR